MPPAHDGRVGRDRTVSLGGAFSEVATGRGKHRKKARRERATGWRFICCEGRDVAGAALFKQCDELVVDGRIAYSMRKDVYSCACGDLGPVQGDGMGEDLDSG